MLSMLILAGCKAKKETTTVDKERILIENKTVDYISSPIETTLYFPDICEDDLKPRKLFTEQRGNNSAKVYKDSLNRLRIDLKTGFSQIKTDTIYRDREKIVEVKDLEVRYRTPLWHWLAHIISILIIFILIRFKLF